MVTPNEPKINQSNAFESFLPAKSLRTVRRLKGGIRVACKGVATIISVNFDPDQA